MAPGFSKDTLEHTSQDTEVSHEPLMCYKGSKHVKNMQKN